VRARLALGQCDASGELDACHLNTRTHSKSTALTTKLVQCIAVILPRVQVHYNLSSTDTSLLSASAMVRFPAFSQCGCLQANPYLSKGRNGCRSVFVGKHRRFDRSNVAIPRDHPPHGHLQPGSLLLVELRVALHMDVRRRDRCRRFDADVSCHGLCRYGRDVEYFSCSWQRRHALSR
jgi:hypothetical protein